MTGIDAYPLQWPTGRPRTKSPRGSRFETSFSTARDTLMAEIKMLSGTLPVLSTNIPLRRDGLPGLDHGVGHPSSLSLRPKHPTL